MAHRKWAPCTVSFVAQQQVMLGVRDRGKVPGLTQRDIYIHF